MSAIGTGVADMQLLMLRICRVAVEFANPPRAASQHCQYSPNIAAVLSPWQQTPPRVVVP